MDSGYGKAITAEKKMQAVSIHEETHSLVISKMMGRFHIHQVGEVRVIKYLTGRDAENLKAGVK